MNVCVLAHLTFRAALWEGRSTTIPFLQMEIQTQSGSTTFRSGQEVSCPGSHDLEGFALVLLQPASFHGGKRP